MVKELAAAHVSGIVTDLAAAFTDDGPSVKEVLLHVAVPVEEVPGELVGKILEIAQRLGGKNPVGPITLVHPSQGKVEPVAGGAIVTDALDPG
jgi:hypothetical protein